MSIGKEIRKRRKALGWTLIQLANLVDGDPGNLSRLETGKQRVNDDILQKIALAMGCNVADFYSGGDASSEERPVVPLGSRRVPLITYAQAGTWVRGIKIDFSNDPRDSVLVDLTFSPDAFALKIKSEDMLPEFSPGDLIIIEPNCAHEPGDFVVAQNEFNEAIFAKYRPRSIDGRNQVIFELAPLNQDYPSFRSDVVSLTIIGTMLEHRRYRKKQPTSL